MTIEISLRTILIILIILIIITEHLMNWWFRKVDEEFIGPFIIVFIIRVFLIFIAINIITS